MVASQRQTGHESHLLAAPDIAERILPAAVIYGANGSGKSNLVKAIRLIDNLVTSGAERKTSLLRERDPFAFSTRWPQEPTKLEIRFVSGGSTFSLGFSLLDTAVQSEWLSVINGSRETILFERTTDQEGKVTIEVGKVLAESGDYSKTVALSQVGARANETFISAILRNIEPENQGPLLQSATRWFTETLHIIFPESNYKDLVKSISDSEDFAKFMGEFLKDASTGITSLASIRSKLNKEQLDKIPRRFVSQINDSSTVDGDTFETGVAGTEFFIPKAGSDELEVRALTTTHAGENEQPFTLPFFEESDGTCRLTNLLPALHQLADRQRVYIIDELDRSLHPLLAHKFIESFLKIARLSGSQLIVTTHETNLMDLDLLRRDELWLTEKNKEGATSIYSLSEFKVRTDLQIQKGYLCGRFGAIPFLNNIDHLMEQLLSNAENEPSQSKT